MEAAGQIKKSAAFLTESSVRYQSASGRQIKLLDKNGAKKLRRMEIF